MSKAVRAQLYLTLDPAEVERLEILLHEAAPACVRLAVRTMADEKAAATARALCHAREIPLLIAGPDDTAVAMARVVGADGVHLTGTPKAAPWARRELGEDSIIGIDPGPSRHDAMIAAEAGADYVSLSPDWAEGDSVPDEIAWWAAMIETPMVVENAAAPGRAGLLRGVAEFVVAGADGAGAVAGVLD